MLCVYYSLEDKEADYLNSVIVGYDVTKVIWTSHVDEVKDLLKSKHFISIEGLKGCGKSFTCAQVYYELAQSISFYIIFSRSFLLE